MTPRPDIKHLLPEGIEWMEDSQVAYTYDGAPNQVVGALEIARSWWHAWVLVYNDRQEVVFDVPYWLRPGLGSRTQKTTTFQTLDEALQYISTMLCLGEYGE